VRPRRSQRGRRPPPPAEAPGSGARSGAVRPAAARVMQLRGAVPGR
jgi:hypothetical protein